MRKHSQHWLKETLWLFIKVIFSLALNSTSLYAGVWESGGTERRILDLGIRRGWVTSFTPRPLYPEERTPVPTGYEGECVPQPAWSLRPREKSCPAEDRTARSKCTTSQPPAMGPRPPPQKTRWSVQILSYTLVLLNPSGTVGPLLKFVSHMIIKYNKN
jgi:hypothetical protein